MDTPDDSVTDQEVNVDDHRRGNRLAQVRLRTCRDLSKDEK